MKKEFAGLTPSGGKVHRCLSSDFSFCNCTPRYFLRVGEPHFTPFKGTIRRELLCKKCWGNNPSIEELREFGIEITSKTEELREFGIETTPKTETQNNIFSRLINFFWRDRR
jgi:hypothetical protein